MKVTFLGTGTSQGIPMIACDCGVCTSSDYRDRRLRTSIHIADENLSVVIDTGPDFRQQMLDARIKQLDAVLFTHQHKDHTAGLDDIRAFNIRSKQPMPIYGSQEVIEQLKKDYYYAFSSDYPGIPRLAPQVVQGDFSIGNVVFMPIQVMHNKLPVLAYRCGGLCYITDANYINATEKEKCKNAEVLIINSLQIKPHISHFNLDQTLEIIQELSPKRAYLIHIGHRMGTHKETLEKLPPHVSVAYDGLRVFL